VSYSDALLLLLLMMMMMMMVMMMVMMMMYNVFRVYQPAQVYWKQPFPLFRPGENSFPFTRC